MGPAGQQPQRAGPHERRDDQTDLGLDGVGNRTSEVVAGVTDAYAYAATSNRLMTVTRGAATVRQMTYDGAGNILTDNRAGTTTTYTYNNRNRLLTATSGALMWDYKYNAREQLVWRHVDGGSVTHFIHDIIGNVLAERINESSSWREYIWLPEAEIAPTYQSQAQVDRPLAVVDQAFAGAPVMYLVHVDHLHRPIRMTDAAKATVWDATWLPWGGAHAITGSAGLNARFPGQWFQLEAGLHYNWHRHYDASIGRYTQPDPLGFVDGPGVFGYAKGSPGQNVDPDGKEVSVCCKTIDDLPTSIRDWFPSHCWLRTDTKEAGMGGRCADPGNNCSDKPFTQTRINDHAGLSKRSNATCTKLPDVDEDCVNRLLKIGAPTGAWSPINHGSVRP